MYLLYEAMQSVLQQLNDLHRKLTDDLKTLPTGSLAMIRRNEKNYYYHSFYSNGIRQRIYLDPNDPHKAHQISQLKYRRFICSILPQMAANISALEQALRKFKPFDPLQVEKELPPAYQNIPQIQGQLQSDQPELSNWVQEDYEKNKLHPESLIHETICGVPVRSKAEAMIADLLFYYHIPFRYEPIITANNRCYAPDFLILRPRDHKLFYWEHLGLMDSPEYVLDNAIKLMDYHREGIRLNNNLILTLENKTQPLASKEILDIIASQLLS